MHTFFKVICLIAMIALTIRSMRTAVTENYSDDRTEEFHSVLMAMGEIVVEVLALIYIFSN